jgi:hypothetical protein
MASRHRYESRKDSHLVPLPAVLAGIALAIAVAYVALRVALSRLRGGYRSLGDIRSAAFTARTSNEQPVLGGLFSEVDTLRIQVESLRAEMTALTTGSRSDRAKLRPYRSSQYAQLPRPLRRQVREVRNFRHPISI